MTGPSGERLERWARVSSRLGGSAAHSAGPSATGRAGTGSASPRWHDIAPPRRTAVHRGQGRPRCLLTPGRSSRPRRVQTRNHAAATSSATFGSMSAAPRTVLLAAYRRQLQHRLTDRWLCQPHRLPVGGRVTSVPSSDADQLGGGSPSRARRAWLVGLDSPVHRCGSQCGETDQIRPDSPHPLPHRRPRPGCGPPNVRIVRPRGRRGWARNGLSANHPRRRPNWPPGSSGGANRSREVRNVRSSRGPPSNTPSGSSIRPWGWPDPGCVPREQADRWVCLLIAAHTQLRLTRGLAEDLLTPGNSPCPASGSAPVGSAGDFPRPPDRRRSRQTAETLPPWSRPTPRLRLRLHPRTPPPSRQAPSHKGHFAAWRQATRRSRIKLAITR
jgi:hypothetical protein